MQQKPVLGERKLEENGVGPLRSKIFEEQAQIQNRELNLKKRIFKETKREDFRENEKSWVSRKRNLEEKVRLGLEKVKRRAQFQKKNLKGKFNIEIKKKNKIDISELENILQKNHEVCEGEGLKSRIVSEIFEPDLLDTFKNDKEKRSEVKKLQNLKKEVEKPGFRNIPKSNCSKQAPKDCKFFKETFKTQKTAPQLKKISKEIFKYLRRYEIILGAGIDKNEPEILSTTQRKFLIDWIIRISHEMRLMRQTLYLAISIFDRYVYVLQNNFSKPSQNSQTPQFDLLVLASLFMASKYEEMNFPTINDFVFISKFKFSKESFFDAEREILEALGWRLNYCHPMVFFDYYSQGLEIDKEAYHFAQFLIETLLYSGKNKEYKDSLLGAGTLYLLLKIFKKKSWSPELEIKSLYRKSEVVEVGERLHNDMKMIWNPEEKESAVREKFSEVFYSKIGRLKLSKRLRD